MVKKRTTVKRTTTKIYISDSYYIHPEEVISYSKVMNEDIRFLRTKVQEYAGRNRIDEDQVILWFEQEEITEEEAVAQTKGGVEL